MKHEKAWLALAVFGYGNLLMTMIAAFIVRVMYNLSLVSDTVNSVGTGIMMYGIACYGVSLTTAYFLDRYEEKDKRKEVK